ncbi:MAG: hypothetical protein B7X08_03120 [Acidocella sp. 20-63-7]|nr:MAG: hypothetical protein B7X08_03120 [Acidocella sp. 20-63-7]HQT45949.1 VOC family protein [Acidocella sp.]
MQINPYLGFNGSCAEAFKFYETVLGGKITFMMTYAQAPMETPAGWGDKIIHTTLAVGQTVLMGGDAPTDHYRQPAGFSISIGIEDPTKATVIFNALAAGETITMPLEETFWAKRFGMVTDRYGTPWMVNCGTG